MLNGADMVRAALRATLDGARQTYDERRIVVRGAASVGGCR